MQKFNEFRDQDETIQALLEVMFLMDTPQDQLNEMFETDSDDLLNEAIDLSALKGLIHTTKTKGLIGYFKSAGKGIAKIMIAAIKGDTDGIKAVMKTVKKGDVLDFLLKLDQATLHIITGPIHTIEAVTGWHIWAAVEKAKEVSTAAIDKIKNAILTISQNVSKYVDSKRTARIEKHLNAISKSLPA